MVDSADPVALGRWWAEALGWTVFLALGARHGDGGQGVQTWVTPADPEGNEFCVPGARRS